EVQQRTADVARVAEKLPPGAVLVEYVVYPRFDFAQAFRRQKESDTPHLAAFVLPAGRPEQLRLLDLGPAADIDRRITEFRARLLLAQPADEVGRELRGRLIDPLGVADGQRLILALDGELGRLPFEALPAD